MKTVLAVLFWLVFAGNAASGQVHVLRFGRLVDGRGGVLPDAVIVVERDRITRVAAGDDAVPAGASVIDLRRYTAVPGLIDLHTHMTYAWDRVPGTRPWGQGASRTMEQTLALIEENAQRTLETGVTTVRDLGAGAFLDVLVRDRIASGEMPGPRMFVSGHGLQRVRTPPRAGGPPATARGRVLQLSDVAQAVRLQVEGGADVIKMYGSTGSGADVTGEQTFSFEEMKAAVDAAHAHGRRIAIHSYGPDGARAAVRAGAESLEHAVHLDDTTLADMVRRGTVYVPTIDHNRFYAEYAADFGYSAEQVAALNAFRERNLATARRAVRAGVTFGMGSDAVFHMFGQNTRELEWFVRAGMTPAQALATATTNAAALLGMQHQLGAIAPGFLADIIAIEGDPLADINAVIHGVRWVMKAGRIVVDHTKGAAR